MVLKWLIKRFCKLVFIVLFLAMFMLPWVLPYVLILVLFQNVYIENFVLLLVYVLPVAAMGFVVGGWLFFLYLRLINWIETKFLFLSNAEHD